MKTHTIRPTQRQFGFVIDDEIIIFKDCDTTKVIHLNKGPKKPEDYKDYSLIDPWGLYDRGSYYCTEYNLNESIYNEHICVKIIIKDKIYYMKGIIPNFFESDLDNIYNNSGRTFGVFSSGVKYIKRKKSTQDIGKYLESVFGSNWSNVFPKKVQEYYGVELFEKRIYLNPHDMKFAIDLTDITLKDKFNELIKSNIDKIKEILFSNDIPNDPKYSTY